MAGRINVYGTFGVSPGTESNLLGSINFTQEDSFDSKAQGSPIGKPSETTNTSYSYERYIRFKVVVAPQNQFTNFRIWSGSLSSPATGVVFKVGTTSSYVSPIQTESTKASHLLHSTYPSYNNSLLVPGTLVNVNDASKYAVFQCHVTSAASNGMVDSTKTIFHIAYDES